MAKWSVRRTKVKLITIYLSNKHFLSVSLFQVQFRALRIWQWIKDTR
jgi:hypothetical protein